MQSVHIHDDHRLRQFTQFLRWSITAEIILGMGEFGLGWARSLLALNLVGVITLLGAVAMLFALWLIRRTQVLAAVATISVACCAMAVLYMLAMPTLLPVCVLFVIGAIGLPMLFSSRQLFGAMVILAVITMVILAALEFLPPIIPQASEAVGHMVNLFSLPIIVAILALLFSHISQNALASLQSTQAANQDLHLLKDQLEAQVEQRTADLRTALATVESQAATQGQLLAEVAQQREAIRELSVPVLPVAHDTLVMPLIGALDTNRLHDVQSQALQSIERSAARRLLLDVTGVPVIDTQVARGLITTINAVRLLGAEAVLIGIRPEVAQTIVGLGMNMSEVRAVSDLQTAIAQTTITSAGPDRSAAALRPSPPRRG